LNISKLGAVCNTYKRNVYGAMRDGMNSGLESDRFQVDWWINTKRVEQRMSKRKRRAIKLIEYEKAETPLLYKPYFVDDIHAPPQKFTPPVERLTLAEIPEDFLALKAKDINAAKDWRSFTREVFEAVFHQGYLVTDFIHDRGRSFYVLTNGESTLD
jgi:predicted GNAT superfamily acetyltransferase